MKEKTFEELIENYTFYDRSDYAKKEPILDKADVLQLLQQVREATIAECVEILTNPNVPKSRMASLKTDQIKTKQ